MKNERSVFDILADLKQALKEGHDAINDNLVSINNNLEAVLNDKTPIIKNIPACPPPPEGDEDGMLDTGF